MTNRKIRSTRLLNVNETYENSRLLSSIGEGTPCDLFIAAVRAFATCQNHSRKAHLVEAIIRTSRGLVDENDLLPTDVKEALWSLFQTYRAYGPGDPIAIPITFNEARCTIKAIFF